jgi:6-hydroxymethylpterin diphosphokinase MptE-like
MSELEYESVAPETLKVIDFENCTLANGRLNVEEAEIHAHIQQNIRLGHPQVQQCPVKADHLCLVGGGASLEDTEHELVNRLFAGAKLITMNGSYQWAIQRNLRPSTQVIVDARPSNARFLDPPIPNCRYLLASQCHPDVFKAAADRDVWIFHAVDPESGVLSQTLDAYYLKHWHPVLAGTTVATRALMALRLLGYLRFDLFGIDCCWRGEAHHAFPQPENDRDTRVVVELTAPQDTERRRFVCSPTHLKQFEDLLQLIRINGEQFLLNVHGDGMLAYALARGAATATVIETLP